MDELLKLLELARAGNEKARAALREMAPDLEPRAALVIRTAELVEADRSVPVVVTTEARVQMVDWEEMTIIDEILRTDGAEFPEERQVPLLDTHDRWNTRSQYGSIRELAGNELGVVGSARFASDQASLDAWGKVRDGHLTKLSGGYLPIEKTRVKKGEKAVIKGRTYEGPVSVVTRWKLREGSLCSVPADMNAKVLRSRACMETLEAFRGGQPANSNRSEATMEVELQDGRKLTWAQVDAERAAGKVVILKDGTRLEAIAPALTDAARAEIESAAVTRESERVSQIELYGELTKATPEEIRAAKDGKVAAETFRKTREDAYRKANAAIPPPPVNRPASGGVSNKLRALVMHGADAIRTAQAREGTSTTGEAAQIASAMRRECSTFTGLYRTIAMETGEIRDMEGAMAMRGDDIINHLMDKNAHRFRRQTPEQLLQRSGGGMVSDLFPNILLDAMHKEAEVALQAPAVTWNQVAVADSLPDLRDKNLLVPAEPFRLRKSQERKGLEFFNFLDATRERYRVTKYRGGISITREMLINDDMGMFMDQVNEAVIWIPAQIDEDFWFNWLANPVLSDSAAFFAVAAGNVLEGTNTALTESNLATSNTALSLAEDEWFGRFGRRGKDKETSARRLVALEPRLFIVPSKLRRVANLLNDSPTYLGQANSNVPNPSRAKYTVISVPYLQHADVTAASAVKWYLTAGRESRFARVGFLNGNQSPEIENWLNYDEQSIDYGITHWWAPKLTRREYTLQMTGAAAV